MFYLISLTEPSSLEHAVFLYFMPLPFFQRFCGGSCFCSFLSKWTVLLRSESTYGLVSELDRISPSQTENKFDLFPHRCPSVLYQTSFCVPDNTLGMFYSFFLSLSKIIINSLIFQAKKKKNPFILTSEPQCSFQFQTAPSSSLSLVPSWLPPKAEKLGNSGLFLLPAPLSFHSRLFTYKAASHSCMAAEGLWEREHSQARSRQSS